ncbi:sulfatase-like hydrolase/transferase [Alkalibacter saccharofermentans]|uniref:Sulfatase N-terminal domain-containing protein n=1 Tax=Alkalibacter saccharofermentans DSM 14828 TaxID=1120975 RepID=A0A1M4U4R4_9FIRM|nr:sulfatase-like hydrolase/transferase [Alkalibacter saccharofermentans]SHE51811.1 protein of unknown function [Alkalibacter saccharofermentans DSM 14828]
MKKKPNIVIINPDQMRADTLAHLGNEASITPNLDALAKEGVSFSNAFCQNPVCTPSRCSFMTGWYPHVRGHRSMEYMLHDDEPNLLRNLKNSGYHVWLNQRNDLFPAQYPEKYAKYCDTYFRLPESPDSLPRDNWRGEKGESNYYSFFRGKVPPHKNLDRIWTEGAVEFIQEYDEEKPFCIFLPLMLPHPVYKVSDPFYSNVNRDKIQKRILPPDGFTGKPKIEKELNKLFNMDSWTEEQYKELRAVYLGMCNEVDFFTGMVIDALKAKGIYDNTVIFVFSDHGDYTGDYGLVEKAQNCFEDCLTNVPFIVKLPKEMGRRKGISDELVELIDFYATVEEIADLETTHQHFGKSLVPYLQKNEEELRDAVFSEGGFRVGESYCSETGGPNGLTEENLYYPRLSLQLSNEFTYNGKAVMCRTKEYKYIKRLYEEDEFYDLRNDPEEVSNVINDENYKDEILVLKERLLTHYLDTCDVVPLNKDKRMDSDFIELLYKK